MRLVIVKEVGERRVIEKIRQELTFPRAPIPFGDDVSGVRIERNKIAVLKTDMLVGKTDVPLGMSFWQAGRKAVVMNVSDFAAKGVQPLALLVSLGVPSTFLERDAVQLARGLNAGAREYGAYILGGDTGEASDLVVSCSLFGIGERRLIPLRSGARAGDVVAVTGFFGKSVAGLRLLTRSVSASKSLRKVFLDAVLLPKARLKEGLALAQARVVSGSIDSSDGLAWSLHEIGKASHVGFFIDNLPVAPEVLQFAKRNKLDPLELALYGGEEYELVLTIKPRFWQKAQQAVKRMGGSLLRIGEVTEKADMVLQWNGKKVDIEAKGWEHFKSRA
jgi:thiamine-monophosphate kinase